MSKAKKIVITVIAVLLVLSLAAGFFVPRIMLYAAIKSLGEYPELPVTIITEEQIVAVDYGETQRIEEHGMSMEIPAHLVKGKSIDKTVRYIEPVEEDEKFKTSIIISTPSDLQDLNIIKDGTFDTDTGLSVDMSRIRKGFEAMGGPLPDSGFNTYKRIYLLKDDDYSFWNFNQGAAYFAISYMRSILPGFSRLEIFEMDDKCGFITYFSSSNMCIIDVYSKNDLNKNYTFSIRHKESESYLVYSVLSSIEIVD